MKTAPHHYTSLDATRMTVLFFAAGGLDLLGQFKGRKDLDNINNWVYAQQVLQTKKNKDKFCGFRGGPFLGMKFDCECSSPVYHPWDRDHIAQTASAMMVLDLTENNFERVNKKAILNNLKNHQLSSGSFVAILDRSEDDVRFIYSACLICYLLDDFSSLDRDLIIQYLRSCQTYEGGFGFVAGNEAHGGGTFCSVASLYMLNALDKIPDKEALIRWCIMNQGQGYRGRTNKKSDTCYTFWIGATLKLIKAYELTNRFENYKFVLKCQSGFGGFSKFPDGYPDIMHSHLG
eukprot:UN25111